jgi:hypothetical protein
MQEPIEFLNRFYDGFDHEGVFTIIAMLKTNEDGSPRGKSLNKVFKIPLSEVPHFNWGSVKELNDQKFDIYFGEALRDPSVLEGPVYSRGVAAECAWSGALSLDIDTRASGAHVNEDLPETLEDVSLILDVGPDPSLVVSSGYGYHAHFFYDSPVLLRDKTERNQYSRFRKKAHSVYAKAHKEHGWKMDATHNIDRIWRLPGFLNWKRPDDPVPVTVLYGMDGERVEYSHDVFVPEPAAPKTKPKMPSTTPRKQAQQASEVGHLRKSIESYVAKCYDDALEAERSGDEELEDQAEDIAMRGVYMERLLAGESIEDKGRRDHALTIVCGILCHLTRNITEFSEEDLEFIVTDLMAPSLQKWCDDNEDTDLEREMGKAIDKLNRIKAKDLENQSVALQSMRAALADYTPRELDPLEEGSEPPPAEAPTDAELLRSAMILFKGYAFIWDWNTQAYWGRAVQTGKGDELRGVLRKRWPEGCPIVHTIQNEQGQEVDLPFAHINKNYGSTALDSFYTFLKPRSSFNPRTEIMKVNPRPWRETEPEYIESIDEWLNHLGGSSYDLLCDWLAGCIKLDHPCAALYLHGPPGCGKTMFATGATQLWSDTPTIYKEAAGNFNEGLMNSPIVLVDEGFSESTVKNPTATLRRLVATRTHTVNEKHGLKMRLDGYMRLIIAANNDAVLLSGKEERLSEYDTRAMKERIAYVHIKNDAARNFFARHNKGNKLTSRWIGNGEFARHLLWLSAQRPLDDRGRFLVEGEDSPMHKQMLFQGNERNEVLEWCCLFAEAPKKLNARVKGDNPKPALIGDGIVAVNTQMARGRWEEFSTNKDVLTHSHLLRHLKSLSPLDSAIQVRVGGSVVRYWVIPIDIILTYADSHDIGDLDRIRAHAAETSDTTNSLINSKFYKAHLAQD